MIITEQGIYPERENGYPFIELKALHLSRSKGYMFDYEVLALSVIAKMLPEKAVVVNIGAGEGTSCIAVLEVRPDLAPTFYSVDRDKGGTPFGGLENELKNFNEYKVVYPNQILSDSSTLGNDWTVPVDMLFVDGDHSEEGITKDINAWKKHVKVGGFMIFHDYNHAVWPGVKKVVDKLMTDFVFIGNIDITGIFKRVE